MDHQLPESMISEIFSWLPAKSIFRFKLCSKAINEFIKEANFAEKQTQNLTTQRNSSFFIQAVFGWNKSKTELRSLFVGNEASSSSGIPPNFLQFLSKRNVRILLSYMGLLLCEIERQGKSKEVELFICNPATQTCSPIVTPPSWAEKRHYIDYNFYKGVDDEEYQLVLLEYNDQSQEDSEHFVFKAYMPKEGVWIEREKSSFADNMLSFYFIFERYILSWHMDGGETRRILFPKLVPEIGIDDLNLFKWDIVGGSNYIDDVCLVIFEKDDLVFSFWGLTDYESSSWSKFWTLRLKEMGLRKNTIIHGFSVMNGDSLVFATSKYVYRYDLIGERGSKLERICEHKCSRKGLICLEFIPYSNTLCSYGDNVKDVSFFMSKKRART
ncbi:hypothetical protein K1719_013587 [Acacia pycnantha]|nr:hypothetical protein K1719_013587 [Acacia pycnantha]